jgi:hypothetical protein
VRSVHPVHDVDLSCRIEVSTFQGGTLCREEGLTFVSALGDRWPGESKARLPLETTPCRARGGLPVPAKVDADHVVTGGEGGSDARTAVHRAAGRRTIRRPHTDHSLT